MAKEKKSLALWLGRDGKDKGGGAYVVSSRKPKLVGDMWHVSDPPLFRL